MISMIILVNLIALKGLKFIDLRMKRFDYVNVMHTHYTVQLCFLKCVFVFCMCKSQTEGIESLWYSSASLTHCVVCLYIYYPHSMCHLLYNIFFYSDCRKISSSVVGSGNPVLVMGKINHSLKCTFV